MGFGIKALALMRAISPQTNQMTLDSSKQNWPQGMAPCWYFYPHSLSPSLLASFLARNHAGKMGVAQSKLGSAVALCSLGLFADSHLTVPCHWEIKQGEAPSTDCPSSEDGRKKALGWPQAQALLRALPLACVWP